MLLQGLPDEPVENANMDSLFNKSCKKRKFLIKILLGIIIITASVSSGMSMGYSAILLPQLKSASDSLYTDEEMGSWIASLQSIGNPTGALIGGILMEHIGRKPTIQIQTSILTIAWLLCATCWNHKILLFGRFLSGISNGISMTASQIYIAEVTHPQVRGLFSAFTMVSCSLGIFLVYLLGSFINWRLMAGISAITPTITTFLYFILPESPVWLVRHNYTEKAKKSCLWFRGNDTNKADEEIQELMLRTKNERLQKEDTAYMSTLCKSSVMKPLLILNVYNILQALSGWYLLVVYGVEIIQLTINSNLDKTLTAILSAGIRFLFTLCALFFFASYGRRPIGVYSTLLTAVSASIIGFCLILNYAKSGYFLHLCLLTYIASATIGFTTLKGVISSELLPARVRALLSSVNVIITSLSFFAITKLFPFLRHICGIQGIFLIFGISSFFASVLLWCTLPETKGKTLYEIEDYFSKNNVLWMNRNKNENRFDKLTVNNVPRAQITKYSNYKETCH